MPNPFDYWVDLMNNLQGMIVLFVAALLLGCPGGGTPADTAGGGADTGGTGGGTRPSGGTMDDGDDGSTMDEDGMLDDANDEFEALVENSADLAYLAEYELTITLGGEEMSYMYTNAIKGSNFMSRTYGTILGTYTDSSVYLLGDKQYTCSVVEGETTCYEFPGGEEPFSTSAEGLPEDMELFKAPGRSVAGVAATCFTSTYENTENELCYSREGVLLYLRSDHEGDVLTLEATRVQVGNVPDSTFDLPAEPTSIEDLWGSYGSN